MVDRDGPPAHLLGLPIYLHTYILSHLSEKDLHRVAIASKRLCELSIVEPQAQTGWTFTHGLLGARARLRWGVWASVDSEQKALSAAIARYSRRMASWPLSPPTPPSIPPVVHMIWLGSPPPAYVATMRDSWVQHHPGWECRLWRDADVAHLPQGFTNREAYEAADNYGEKSDILRYEILYQLGGVYADCDMECVAGLHDLHGWGGVGLYAGLSNTGTMEANNGLLGSRPGHPLLARMIDEIRQGNQTRTASQSALGAAGALSALMGGGGVGGGAMGGLMASFLGGADMGTLQDVVSAADRDRAAMETITRTGPGLLSRHLFQSLLNPQPSDSGGDGGDVLILPPLWFYPMPNSAMHAGRPDPEVKARYVHPAITRTIHYWARSWQA